MKRETYLWASFVFYILLPALFLHAVMVKYPGIISQTSAFFTMLYFFIIFVLAISRLYTRWKSVPGVLSIITTMFYLNYLSSVLRIEYMGANIIINLRRFIFLLYLFLILKAILYIYYDVKEKHLSPMKEYTTQ